MTIGLQLGVSDWWSCCFQFRVPKLLFRYYNFDLFHFHWRNFANSFLSSKSILLPVKFTGCELEWALEDRLTSRMDNHDHWNMRSSLFLGSDLIFAINSDCSFHSSSLAISLAPKYQKSLFNVALQLVAPSPYSKSRSSLTNG